MTDRSDHLNQQIGELIADVRSLKEQGVEVGSRFGRIEARLEQIDQKVTQHRTGWQVFMWIGGIALTVAGIVFGYLARK